MTDDQQHDPLEPIPPAEPGTGGTPAGDTPTMEAPAASPTAETPTAPPPPPWGTEPAAPGSAPASPARRTVTMPLWAFATVAGILLLALGFLLGWAVAPGDDDDSVQAPAGNSRELPFGENFNPFGDGDRGRGGGSLLGDTAFLGVVVESSTDPDGAEIVRVAPSSPADEAGLENGDVITEVDGDEVDDAPALTERIRESEPGDTVTVDYERDGESESVDVRLDERPRFEITPPTTEEPDSRS
jgi:membrane-associated protease RseP (regulator of RpoE activity)